MHIVRTISIRSVVMSSPDTSTPDDPAQGLAEKFKKQGHLDNLKKQILAQEVEGGIQLEEFIKNRVKTLVQGEIKEDNSLIFKNRGTNTALLEGKLFKDGLFNLNSDDVEVDKLLLSSLNDEQLLQDINNILQSDVSNENKE